MGIRVPVTPGAIEPLALTPFKAHKIALVGEGGDQRGIFTAGLLDEFQRARFNPSRLKPGTSAGAQNLSAFICGQPSYARRVITRYTTSKRFFDPLRVVRGGNLIDLDWLIEITRSEFPLAINSAEQLFSSGREFYMCACCSDDYRLGDFNLTADNGLDLVKASSAIPGFYRLGGDLQGISYHDEGSSDAIPVREAARRGADTIGVIRTVPPQMFYTPKWFKRMERWFSTGALQPLTNVLNKHEQRYREIQEFIENPPDDLRIIEIFPPHALASSVPGSRIASLNQDYYLRRRCGRYFLATLGQWLSDAEPLTSTRIVTPPAAVDNASDTRLISTPPLADNDADYDKGSLA